MATASSRPLFFRCVSFSFFLSLRLFRAERPLLALCSPQQKEEEENNATMRATLHASSSSSAAASSPSTSKASIRSSPPRRSSARTARPLCPSASFRAIAEPTAVPFTKSADHLSTWAPDSWRKRTAFQQPNYPDAEQVELAAAEIARLPPLVFAGECRTLQARLAKCASGEAFLLQGEREREQNTEERRMASRRRP